MKRILVLMAVLAGWTLFPMEANAQAAITATNCTKLRPLVIDWWLQSYIYPAWAAVNLGYTKKVGCLDVTLNGFKGTLAKNQAFESNRIDALFGAEVTYHKFEIARRETGRAPAIYYGAVSNTSVFDIVGSSSNPADMLGQTVLIAYCPIVGDITKDFYRVASTPTEPLRTYIRENFPEAHIYCLAPGSKKQDDPNWTKQGATTVYFSPLPGSSRRRLALISGSEPFAGVSIDTSLRMVKDDGFKVVVSWKALPKLPTIMLAGRKGNGKKDLYEDFFKSMRATMLYVLAHQDEEISRVTKLAIEGTVRTPFTALVPQLSDSVDSAKRYQLVHSRIAEMFKLGIQDGMWSLSGCIARDSMRNYMTIIMKGSADVNTIVDKDALCPQ